MELIGAGCGRTGTLSLKTALEILGLPCYHMVTILKRGDVAFWHDAADGKAVDFRSVLDGSGAVCDWPAHFFYKELMETYPEAKAIEDVPAYVRWIDGLFPPGPKMGPMMEKVLWQGILKGSFQDPEAAQKCYVEWNESVKQHVPADKLLVFHPSQGWEPLCKFLGRPVPDEPFPRVNDTQGFKDMVSFLHTRHRVMQYGVPAVAAAAVAGLALLLSRSRRS